MVNTLISFALKLFRGANANVRLAVFFLIIILATYSVYMVSTHVSIKYDSVNGLTIVLELKK